MRKIMAHRRYFGKWLPQPLNHLIFSFSHSLIFSFSHFLFHSLIFFFILSFSHSLYAQDQFARHAPTVRRLTHIDTVATHFVLPISETQQASVSGLATINTLIEEAFSHIGKRYRSGGKGPSAFDCSGFTGYVFKKFNYIIGASSRDQYVRNKPIKRSEMRRGDLVFFTSPRSGKNVGHVGIVVDVSNNGESFTFIHASTNEGIKVSRSSDGFYARRYVGVRRVL